MRFRLIQVTCLDMYLPLIVGGVLVDGGTIAFQTHFRAIFLIEDLAVEELYMSFFIPFRRQDEGAELAGEARRRRLLYRLRCWQRDAHKERWERFHGHY